MKSIITLSCIFLFFSSCSENRINNESNFIDTTLFVKETLNDSVFYHYSNRKGKLIKDTVWKPDYMDDVCWITINNDTLSYGDTLNFRIIVGFPMKKISLYSANETREYSYEEDVHKAVFSYNETKYIKGVNSIKGFINYSPEDSVYYSYGFRDTIFFNYNYFVK